MEAKVEVETCAKARERRASVQKAHVLQMSNISNTLTDDASIDPGSGHEDFDALV